MVDLQVPVMTRPAPVTAVHPVWDLLLSEVDQAGVGQDGHGDDDEEEAELLVGLLEGVEQGLEAGKVSDQLEYPEDPHHSHQPDHLPSLTDDLEVLQPLQQQREIERDNGADVNDVHRVSDKLYFVRANAKSEEKL